MLTDHCQIAIAMPAATTPPATNTATRPPEDPGRSVDQGCKADHRTMNGPLPKLSPELCGFRSSTTCENAT
jgi:hypothetical protein